MWQGRRKAKSLLLQNSLLVDVSWESGAVFLAHSCSNWRRHRVFQGVFHPSPCGQPSNCWWWSWWPFWPPTVDLSLTRQTLLTMKNCQAGQDQLHLRHHFKQSVSQLFMDTQSLPPSSCRTAFTVDTFRSNTCVSIQLGVLWFQWWQHQPSQWFQLRPMLGPLLRQFHQRSQTRLWTWLPTMTRVARQQKRMLPKLKKRPGHHHQNQSRWNLDCACATIVGKSPTAAAGFVPMWSVSLGQFIFFGWNFILACLMCWLHGTIVGSGFAYAMASFQEAQDKQKQEKVWWTSQRRRPVVERGFSLGSMERLEWWWQRRLFWSHWWQRPLGLGLGLLFLRQRRKTTLHEFYVQKIAAALAVAGQAKQKEAIHSSCWSFCTEGVPVNHASSVSRMENWPPAQKII